MFSNKYFCQAHAELSFDLDQFARRDRFVVIVRDEPHRICRAHAERDDLTGAQVLAHYKLQLKDSAAKRLREAGFPAQFLQKREGDRTEIVMPAAIAGRDGNRLRSLYFAGDASDYQLISRIAEMFPSTGTVMGFLGKRAGSFSTQHYWNYYEPMLRVALTEQQQIRYEKK